jgi:hypothetical protein
MRVRTLLIVLLLGFLPRTVHADLYCTYTLLGWVDTGYFAIPILNYVCYDVITVSPGPYPVGGGGSGDPNPYEIPPPPPPPAPSVRINYVSDANPGDLQANITVVGGDTMRIYRNAVITNTFPPSETVHLGSLNSCCGATSATDFTIEVCSGPSCGSATFGVVRTPSGAQATGQVLGVYWDIVPDPSGGVAIKRGDVVWKRALALDVIYTGYTVNTRDARNGRVLHRGTSDELFWYDATSRPPIWQAAYSMTPSYYPFPQAYPESDGGGGCSGWIAAPNSDTKCANVSEFALADVTAGSALISSIHGTGSAFVPLPSPATGDLWLPVVP